MKKIALLFVFILSVMLAYFSATGVNQYNLSQLQVNQDNSAFDAAFNINNFDVVDRDELIDELINVADEHSLLLTSGWASPTANEFYYYGDSEYLEYTLLNNLVRTKDNPIQLDDELFLLNSYEENEYGRIYIAGNFPSWLNTFEFYSLKKMKSNNISLDFRVRVTSLYGEEAVGLAVQDLSERFKELDVFYSSSEGALDESEFTWNDTIGTYLILSLVLVILLVVLSMIIVIKKQQRYIVICRMHGISSRQITSELFGVFLVIVWIVFVAAAGLFDYVIIGRVAHYNILFYQIQGLIIALLIIILWIAFEIANRFVYHFSKVDLIKTKEMSQRLLYGGLAIKFVLIVVLLSNYVLVYFTFIDSYQAYSYYKVNEEEFSKISYVSGSMTDLSIEETRLINSEIREGIDSENIELYCVSHLESSDELDIDTLRGLNVTSIRLNHAYVKRYLPDFAQEIDYLDSYDEPMIFIPKSLQSKKRQIQEYLVISNDEGSVHFVDKIPEVLTYLNRPVSSEQLILIVDNFFDDFTGPQVMRPCYLVEDKIGSSDKIDSVVSFTSHPDCLVAYSNEADVKRSINDAQSNMVDSGVQVFLAISIVITFFLMMLILYLYTNLKEIVIKKNHGQNDVQVFSYFFIINSVIYGVAGLYLALVDTLNWISVSLLALFMIIEYGAIKSYLFIHKKNFKQWLS